ncbi:MAG: hypothetical protein ABI304_09025 [Rudaea sp.]
MYWPGLHGPLVFDDAANLEPINDWLRGNVDWFSVVFGNDSGLLGRPISMASFVANVALLGPSTWGLKLGNLLVHLVNGAVVFALFVGLIRRGMLNRDTSRNVYWLAWLGASIWLLHPLLASTVLYVVQRMAMLSALFMLLAMLAYLHGRIALNEQRNTTAYTLLALAVPICTILAALSKENGILAPALCALIELFAFQPATDSRRAWQSKAFIGAVLILPAVIAIVLTVAQVPFITAGYASRPFTLSERLLTETRVLWSYIGNLVVPGRPTLGFYHDDYPISHSLFAPMRTWLAIVAGLATIGAAWRLRKIIPGFALGFGIFLVSHSLESTVFPLAIYFEHRNYLPAVGAIWAILSLLVFLAHAVRPHLRNATVIFSGTACIVVLMLAFSTHIRAQVWSSQPSMIAQAVLAHPNSMGARFDAIILALAQNPPAIADARKNADWLRDSTDPTSKRLGTIERIQIDCTAGAGADPDMVRQMFAGRSGRFEEDLLHAFELLSDQVGMHPCPGLSPVQMASGLTGMLDRWTPAVGNEANWRLRFRAANLYMAADHNADAIEQAKLAYYKGSPPVNTAIMIAGVLIYCGNTPDSKHILDSVEPLLRPSDLIAHKIIADDRNKILKLEQSPLPPKTQQ